MCRPYCTTPDFRSLPRIPNLPPHINVREVHGVWMTEEEYRVTGWHSRGTYTSGKGVTEHLWIAPMGGHILWAQQTWRNREQNIAAAQQRRANDDEYSAAVVAQIEEATR